MSLQKFLNQQFYIHKNSTTGKDEYGNTTYSDSGVVTPVLGYMEHYLEQSNSVENLEDRDTVVTGWNAWLPADADITAFDRLVFDGRTFEVDGEPWKAYNPRTASVSHVVVHLKVVL